MVLWESRATKLCTCQTGRIFGSCYRNKCLHLASEKFVLASVSNLSLATGPASWKVSFEPSYILRFNVFINFFLAQPPSREGGRWETKHFIGMALECHHGTFMIHEIHFCVLRFTLTLTKRIWPVNGYALYTCIYRMICYRPPGTYFTI